MAFFLKAAKGVMRISSKSQSSFPKSAVYFTRLEKNAPFSARTFSSSARVPHADFFYSVTAETLAYCRHVIPVERERIGDSETGFSDLSQLTRDCVLRVLNAYSEEDLRKLLMFCVASSPELVKVTDNEIIRKMALEIPYPKMINTIADECEVRWVYRYSRFRTKFEPDLFYMFVNVSDLEQETLKVFVCEDRAVLIGKPTTISGYDETKWGVESDILSELSAKFGLELATGEIIATSRLPPLMYDFKQATFEFLKEELKISFPFVTEEVEGLEELVGPSCLQVQPKQLHD